MKRTISEWEVILQGLGIVQNVKHPENNKLSYAVMKNFTKINAALQTASKGYKVPGDSKSKAYQKAFNIVVENFKAAPDGRGNYVTSDPDKQEGFEKAIKQMRKQHADAVKYFDEANKFNEKYAAETELSVDIHMVSHDALPPMSGNQLSAIDFMLTSLDVI